VELAGRWFRSWLFHLLIGYASKQLERRFVASAPLWAWWWSRLTPDKVTPRVRFSPCPINLIVKQDYSAWILFYITKESRNKMPIDGYRAICTNRECKKGRFGLDPAEIIPAFCRYCGAEVISACPNCKTAITKLWGEWDADQPNNCEICGEVLRRKIDGETHPTIRAIE
jgi:hypothetical protein